MPETEFQKLLEQMVRNIIKKETEQLTREEVKSIIKELIPEINTIIAKQIKHHFVALAYAIQTKFTEENEEKMDAKDT